MKTTAIVLGIIIVILLCVVIFARAPQPQNGGSPSPSSTTVQIPPSVTSSDGTLQIDVPHPNSVIPSPVAVSGLVHRGGWFFEGSFPVDVIDGDGTVLGTGSVQAEPLSAWTSTGTVPFTGVITYSAPHSATGTVVFHNDNPSGLPQNAKSVSIPVNFR